MDKETQIYQIAVDFDATLARYTDYKGPDDLGEPIPEMIAKVKAALQAGSQVRIFTARVYPGQTYDDALKATESCIAIAEWCKKHIGQLLPIEFAKSPHVDEFWDDRARQVIKNTGIFVTELSEEEGTK